MPATSTAQSRSPAGTYDGQVVRTLESILACPVCREPLAPRAADDDGARVLWCAAGHRFDAARQGYFNLLTGRGTPFQPDSAEMVQARIDFLGRGHYEPLAAAVRKAVATHAVPSPVILDAGAGTGYYLRAVLEGLPSSSAIALDISKFALRRAARFLPSATCLVWDVWRSLPIQDGAVDVILNIFAPRNPAEFDRVLSSGGLLIVVTPLPQHLDEISDSASLLEIPQGKNENVASSLSAFTEAGSVTVEFEMDLTASDIADVAAMGPAGHHQPRLDPESLPARRKVTAGFTVQSFQRGNTGPDL